jgi:hypothetical protein
MKKKEKIISTSSSLKYLVGYNVKPPKLYRNDNRIPPTILKRI